MQSGNSLPTRPKTQGRPLSSEDRRRVAMPRRSTRGPLDDAMDEDPGPPPLQAHAEDDLTSLSPKAAQKLDSPEAATRSILKSPSLATPTDPIARRRSPSPGLPRLDLSFLLASSLYNPMPPRDVAQPYQESRHQPAMDTPLDQLLSKGLFRHAADRAADELTAGALSPFDHAKILYLYQIRLSCLMLVLLPDLAIQEARPLIEFLAQLPPFSQTQQEGRSSPLQLIPWDLRLLLQRLQTLSINDNRRGIMSLYALGTECRAMARNAPAGSEDQKIWTERLADLGIRVAAELIEIQDFDAAIRHLASLPDLEDNNDGTRAMLARRVLLYFRVGDVDAASKTIELIDDKDGSLDKAVLSALKTLADGEYTVAAKQLITLRTEHPDNDLIAANLAVALLYAGQGRKSDQLLERLVDKGFNFSGLLFNLATMYELRTERARDRKLELAIRAAELGPDEKGLGWERNAAEFKL